MMMMRVLSLLSLPSLGSLYFYLFRLPFATFELLRGFKDARGKEGRLTDAYFPLLLSTRGFLLLSLLRQSGYLHWAVQAVLLYFYLLTEEGVCVKRPGEPLLESLYCPEMILCFACYFRLVPFTAGSKSFLSICFVLSPLLLSREIGLADSALLYIITIASVFYVVLEWYGCRSLLFPREGEAPGTPSDTRPVINYFMLQAPKGRTGEICADPAPTKAALTDTARRDSSDGGGGDSDGSNT